MFLFERLKDKVKPGQYMEPYHSFLSLLNQHHETLSTAGRKHSCECRTVYTWKKKTILLEQTWWLVFFIRAEKEKTKLMKTFMICHLFADLLSKIIS